MCGDFHFIYFMQKLMRSDAGSEMNSLACMQLQLGLHQDGFELLEKAIGLQRRAFPHNHPSIGDDCVCLLFFLFFMRIV